MGAVSSQAKPSAPRVAPPSDQSEHGSDGDADEDDSMTLEWTAPDPACPRASQIAKACMALDKVLGKHGQ
jgi:hypothetical protein